jgi:hypothetical protein
LVEILRYAQDDDATPSDDTLPRGDNDPPLPPRLDPETLRIELAVADLLDTVLLRHIGFGNRGGYERLWLGQAIHSHYQEEALAEDATYRREVAMGRRSSIAAGRCASRAGSTVLRKRWDGTLVVEEIKSVRRGGQLSAVQREIYERQALLYAWMVQKAEPKADGRAPSWC